MKTLRVIKYNINEILKRIKSIRQPGSFARNFSFTLSGNVFGILLSLFFAPIMSRIYPPESYGLFSVFSAIIGNLTTFSLLNYNIALIIPKELEKFNNLLRLNFTLSLFFSLIVSIITIFNSNELLVLFNIKNLGNLIFLLGPVLLLSGIATILGQWLTREKEFKKLALANSTSNLMTKIIALTLGYFSKGNVYGFVFGDVIGKVVANIMYTNKRILNNLKSLLLNYSFREILLTAKEFRKYPLVVLPGEYINLFSAQLPVYLISIYFGSKELGYYAFATNILGMPMGVFASAVRPVFFQKASSVYQEEKSKLGTITSDLFKYLFIIGIIPFSILTVFGDWIFAFVFGYNWYKAGLYAGILGYYYVFRLISSPISSILWVIKKEKEFFIFQIFLFTTRLLSLVSGVFIFNDIIITLVLFSIANTLNYLILTVFILKNIGVDYIKITRNTVMTIIIIFSFLYVLKLLLSRFISV